MKRNNSLLSSWRLSVVVVVVVLAAYSWFASGLRAFTLPVDLAVGVPVVLLLGLSWRRSGLGRPPVGLQTRPNARGTAVWAALIGVLAAWELVAYVSSSRHAHPTLSSISDSITSGHAARAVVFGLWIIVGWRIFLPRTKTSGTRAG
jgi:hypothetical protein